MPFEKIYKALNEVLKSGQAAVDIAALKQFLQSVEKDVPLDREVMKLQHESRLAQYKAERDIDIEMLKSVIETAKTALNSSILINGGAAAAVLALVGNIYGKGATPGVPVPLVYGLVAFTSGVLLGGLATAGTYLTQYWYRHKENRKAVACHIASALLVLGSYVTFLCGIVYAYRAFVS